MTTPANRSQNLNRRRRGGTSKGGVELEAWKRGTDEKSHWDGLDQKHHHHRLHGAKLPPTQRHRELAWE